MAGKEEQAVAKVDRRFVWRDGKAYELREGRTVTAPAEVIAFLRRIGYVEPAPENPGGDG